jgi:dTDP-4-dehydrorhamnose reductase
MTMEIWGGIECTINRVDDQYFDQLDYQGLYTRKNDLNLIVGLGVKKLRYPVLWEKHQPPQDGNIDWSFVDGQVSYLQKNGVDIIAGLVHHGSGPAFVNILDDSFAIALADYASKVAMQFPSINYFTPVNEPLTTARFCGLYGLWFPHKKDDFSFLRILYNECKGTALAMNAIRKVNPNAKLVHTEDIGKTHSTPKLAYQATFENKRKWIGMDLLCGKVNPKHDLYDYLIKHGINKEELAYFVENPCPPDILGFNHYITSERFLDEDIATYPVHTHGRNRRHAYADVEAVRSSYVELDGPRQLLKEAWQRYDLPIAITEAHLHCGREDQLRWLKYLVKAAKELQEEGVDIRGVTAWSLFGAYGWDQLLTTKIRNYESGVFDVRTGVPRATALAKLVKSLAENLVYDHPVMEQSGWWMRPDRILYPNPVRNKIIDSISTQPILIIGASGTLGSAFSKICTDRNLAHVPLSRHQLNFGIIEEIEAAIELYKPWAIINAAGFIQIDAAEYQPDDCFLSNTIGPVNLAVSCRKHGIKLLTFSSDQVFDGKKKSEYTEYDDVNPLNLFGLSKAKAEELVLQEYAQSLIIRTSELLSPWAPDGFITNVLSALNEHKSVDVANDLFVSPTLITDLINSSLDLLIDDESEIWHLANQGTISWADLAREVAFRGRYSTSLLVPKPHADLNFNAIRPSYTGLTSDKGIFLPTLENALDRYFKTIE